MPANIENIRLWDKEVDGNCENKSYNKIPLVRINFKFPCTWTTLGIEDLKQIIRLWIKGEEIQYPQEEGFKGRWLLFEEIKKVFDEKEVKDETNR